MLRMVPGAACIAAAGKRCRTRGKVEIDSAADGIHASYAVALPEYQ
jgi:hypothetical protein